MNPSVDRYKSLGLLVNPFLGSRVGEWPAMTCEVAKEGHRLLGAIEAARAGGDSRPIWVDQPADWAETFALEAEARVEFLFSNDTSLNTLHAYVPLPAMRAGAVRAILGVLSERLMFRDFNKTLIGYTEKVLVEPDEDLASYKLLGPENLAEFRRQLTEAPMETIAAVFGDESIERKVEFAEKLDDRQYDVEALGDSEDSEGEIDASLGLAPGVSTYDEPEEESAEEAVTEEKPPDLHQLVLDYLVEHTRVHLSPVVARALRVYRERGQVAGAAEFKVTKAPRKTLSAVVRFAHAQFDDVVMILSEFEQWADVPQESRHRLVGSLSELRWSLGSDGRLVFIAPKGRAPELEETFASSVRLEWTFETMREPERFESKVDEAIVDSWLAAAAAPGSKPLTVAGTGLASLVEQSDGTYDAFVLLAKDAVDDAAMRGMNTIDDQAVAAALQSAEPVEQEG